MTKTFAPKTIAIIGLATLAVALGATSAFAAQKSGLHSPPSDRTSQGSLIDPNYRKSQGSIVDPNERKSQGSLVDPNERKSRGSTVDPNFRTGKGADAFPPDPSRTGGKTAKPADKTGNSEWSWRR